MLKKKTVVIGAIGVFCSLNFGGCGEKTTDIDLMNYVDVSFSGVDGKGTADYNVDADQFEQDVLGDTTGSQAEKDFAESISDVFGWAEFLSSIQYQFSGWAVSSLFWR